MNSIWNIYVAVVVICYWKGLFALKNVVLDIEPRIVQRGGYSTLTCTYDLEDSQLYTVKWYRGQFEFYRYTPSEHPNIKIFKVQGVHVDSTLSNEYQVVLQKVEFQLSGNFSCEVTTEAPFSAVVAFNAMFVVVLPESPPTLTTDKSYYVIGDVLRANCTSPPSRPKATLHFLINNRGVCQRCTVRPHSTGDLFWSELSLDLPLFASHFENGRLVLRCTAKVNDWYEQDTEIRLDNVKDPVPARVTAGDYATSTHTIGNLLTLGIFLFIVSILR